MYAMTWNAALIAQSGLQTAIKVFNSDAPLNPEMVDGFHMAHAGQLTLLTAERALSHCSKKTVTRATLSSLAAGGLDLGHPLTFDSRMAEILSRVHEARMTVDPRWFASLTKRASWETPMPSSFLQSSMLYWSVLLEDPDAMVQFVTAEAKWDGLNSGYQSDKESFQIALASLLTQLPQLGALESAGRLAQDNFRLSTQYMTPKETHQLIERVGKELHAIPKRAFDDAICILRSRGGLWSPFPTIHGDVKPDVHFKTLPQFDPVGDAENRIATVLSARDSNTKKAP
jgi:hypothetical protein